MAKENSVLAIDVGAASLKMAEFTVNGAGESVSLERYAVKEFVGDLNETGVVEAFAATFQQMLQENTFFSRQVRLSISSMHSFQRLSKLPPLMGNRARAAQVVEGEAKQTVPYPLEEVIWDYQLIKHTRVFEVKSDDGAGSMDSVEELEALFIAVKEDLLTALGTVLLDAGFEVLSVEVAPTAIYNAAKANGLGEGGCDMILDLGGRGSNLIFVEGGRVFLRAIPIGGNTITQQIAKEFGIEFNDAEEMKRKHCFVALGGAYEDSDSQVAATISKIARNVMTRLHGEINRSINAWRSLHDGNRPRALYITGGSSIIPYVPHFLNEKLHLGVEFLNVFPVVSISEIVDKEALLEVAHIFPPLVGLAIRHIRTCPVEITLIPKIIRAHRDLQKKKPFFYASAACALLALLVFCAGVSARMSYDKRLSEEASGELQSTEEIAAQIKSLNRQLNSDKDAYQKLAQVVESRSAWPDLLNELQKLTPENMWFTRINGLSAYVDPQSAESSRTAAPEPGMMEDPGMGDPGGGMAMAAAPTAGNEVTWLRLQGHSLVYDAKAVRGTEDIFTDRIKKSEFFDPENIKTVQLNYKANSNNNLTSFVIYVKLRKPIKQ